MTGMVDIDLFKVNRVRHYPKQKKTIFFMKDDSRHEINDARAEYFLQAQRYIQDSSIKVDYE